MVTGLFSIALGDGVSSACTGEFEVSQEPMAGRRHFVAGPENRLLETASRWLLDSATSCSPLLLYGASGVGKSTLAIGLAQRWRDLNPERRVTIMSAADFARRYAHAVDTSALKDFREPLRRSDLLVLDDLHHIVTKRAALEELSRTISALVDEQALVVITCADHPARFGFPPQLTGRLSAGLSVLVQPPGPDAQRQLVLDLVASLQVSIEEDALSALLGYLNQNGRPGPCLASLRRATLELQQQAAPADRITADEVDRYLHRTTQNTQPTLASITSKVAHYFAVTSKEMKGATRRQNVVRARGLAMYLARQLTDSSLHQVGRFFGNRDHTTVLHACRKTEALVKSEAAMKQALEKLSQALCPTLS